MALYSVGSGFCIITKNLNYQNLFVSLFKVATFCLDSAHCGHSVNQFHEVPFGMLLNGLEFIPCCELLLFPHYPVQQHRFAK